LEIKTEKKKNKEKEHYLRFGPNLSSAHFGLPFRVAQHPSRSLTCGPRGQTLSLAARLVELSLTDGACGRVRLPRGAEQTSSVRARSTRSDSA
jgi:hypothetical protein